MSGVPKTIPARRTHGTQNLVVLKTKTYLLDIGYILAVREETGGARNACAGSLMASLPHKGHTELTPPPATKMRQHVCKVSAQGSPSETQVPRFFVGGLIT